MTRSTFRVLFYANGSKEKNGIVPIMGRVTINGTVAQFSCKRSIAKELWDAKGNRVKGKSREARETNLTLATELRHRPVDCNPSHDGDNSILLLAAVRIEQHAECAPCHTRPFLVAKL